MEEYINQSMIEFCGLVNNNRIFIAKTLSQLKRIASRYCNNSYNPIDEMRVTIHNINKCENTDIFYLHRLNRVCPNNTIERGIWK